MAKIIIEIDDKQLTKLDRLVNFLEKFYDEGVGVEYITPAPKPKRETKKQIQERMEKLATEKYIKKGGQ